MGTIRVKLDCGHVLSTHTDDLLEHGWTFEKILERYNQVKEGDRIESSNQNIYPGERCVTCFSQEMAKLNFTSVIQPTNLLGVKHGGL